LAEGPAMLVSDSLHDWSRRRGYAPMQLRLMTRRLKMAARAIGQDGRLACLWIMRHNARRSA
jgi:hypothetical protein